MIYYLEDNKKRFVIYVTGEKMPEIGKYSYRAIKITSEYIIETPWYLGDQFQGGNKIITDFELINYLNTMSIKNIFELKIDEIR